MAIQPMALGVTSTPVNALGSFAEGANQRQTFDANNIALAKQGLETVASIALGAMGGKMDGEADPALFEQGLDMLEAQGIKVDQFRGRADVAPLVARSSMTALQQLQVAQDEQTYNLAMEKFQAEIAAAAQPKPGFTTMTPEQTSGLGLNGVYQLGPDGKIVEVPGAAAEKPPSSVAEYQFYVEQEKAAGREPLGVMEYEQAKKGNGLTVTTNPDGTTTVQQGGSPKPLTEGQSKDAVYVTKAQGALPALNQHANELLNPVARAVEGDATGVARGALQSEEYQQARQAGLEFLAAILRKDTGAAVTASEEDMYGRIYLPIPGDLPAVLQQKEQARNRAVEAIKAGMAPQAILNSEIALANSGSGASDAPDTGEPAKPTTEAEYNALPSGATFVDPDDGKTYRKP